MAEFETIEQVTYCLTAAVVAGRLHPSIANGIERYWMGRLREAGELLGMHGHCSPAARGLVLVDWAGFGGWRG